MDKLNSSCFNVIKYSMNYLNDALGMQLLYCMSTLFIDSNKISFTFDRTMVEFVYYVKIHCGRH